MSQRSRGGKVSSWPKTRGGTGSHERTRGARLKGREWPDWWSWELELSPHLLKRMEDRGFSEVDLREMLEAADGCREDFVEGRWVVETRHRRRSWEIVVEPDCTAELLVVVTGYPLTRRKR